MFKEINRNCKRTKTMILNINFLKYKEAAKLKLIGFDEPCLAFIDVYNGQEFLFLEPRTEHHWIIRVYDAIRGIKPHSIIEYSQSQLEYEEGVNAILTPTYQQAFDWFREQHNLEFQIKRIANGNYHAVIHKNTDEYIEILREIRGGCVDEVVDVYTYEDARLKTLKKLIEIVKENKK